MTTPLTPDQEHRIAATLRRIRSGLAKACIQPFAEPAHYFDPEVHDGTTD